MEPLNIEDASASREIKSNGSYTVVLGFRMHTNTYRFIVMSLVVACLAVLVLIIVASCGGFSSRKSFESFEVCGRMMKLGEIFEWPGGGKYKVMAKLGANDVANRGAMCTAQFKVLNLKDKRQNLMKMYKNFGYEEDMVEAMLKLKLKNVESVVEKVQKIDGSSFMVTSLVSGRPMQHVWQNPKTSSSQKEALQDAVLNQLVVPMRKQGLVYLDMHMKNVFLVDYDNPTDPQVGLVDMKMLLSKEYCVAKKGEPFPGNFGFYLSIFKPELKSESESSFGVYKRLGFAFTKLGEDASTTWDNLEGDPLGPENDKGLNPNGYMEQYIELVYNPDRNFDSIAEVADARVVLANSVE